MRDVYRLGLGHAILLTVSGTAIALAGAFGLSRVMQSLLFSVSPTDPATFAAVPALLALVMLVATLIPARRAARIDPSVALRAE